MPRIARFFIGRLHEPLGEIPSVGFAEQFERLQQAADIADGHVWRPEEIPARNPRAIATLNVWESHDALQSFVAGPVHRPFTMLRDEWFERPRAAQDVVFWVRSGRLPTIEQATTRLKLLRAKGPQLQALLWLRRSHPAEDLPT